MSAAVIREAAARCGAVGVGASPPCKAYSTVLADGSTATTEPLIPQTADALRATGLPWWLENVLGAPEASVDATSVVLRGVFFGDAVDRGRRFWLSFPGRLDSALVTSGMQLRERCCLGPRRRWLRLDPLGRPVREPCCGGNLFPVQGRAPTRSTVEENSVAMGVDPGHMGWDRLAQAVPPAMAQLLSGMMAMHVAAERFGAPMITYDEMLADPRRSRAVMRRWLRGTGDAAVEAGTQMEAVGDEVVDLPSGEVEESAPTAAGGAR